MSNENLIKRLQTWSVGGRLKNSAAIMAQVPLSDLNEAIAALSPVLPEEMEKFTLEETEAKVEISHDPDGQSWIKFDTGKGRKAMLNLNNIVLKKSGDGMNKNIMLEALAGLHHKPEFAIGQLLAHQRNDFECLRVSANDGMKYLNYRPLTQQEVGPDWVPKEPVKALRAWVDWVAAQGSLLERQRAPYEDVLRAAPLRLAAFDAAVGGKS